MPLEDKQIVLLLRAECLSKQGDIALKAGDHATAIRMYTEMRAAIQESIKIAERMRAL